MSFHRVHINLTDIDPMVHDDLHCVSSHLTKVEDHWAWGRSVDPNLPQFFHFVLEIQYATKLDRTMLVNKEWCIQYSFTSHTEECWWSKYRIFFALVSTNNHPCPKGTAFTV